MMLCEPRFEAKKHGAGGGIPALKEIWNWFDFSLLLSECGIRKHAGVPAWILCFAYISGLITNASSTNKIVKFISESPLFNSLFIDKSVSQCAMSRFFSKSYNWLNFSVKRLAKLQEKSDCQLSDGDIIALDDTKLDHPYGKKLPFLCWLFDYSDKSYTWCMNVVSTLAVLKNGLEYPLLWRYWVKGNDSTSAEKQSNWHLSLTGAARWEGLKAIQSVVSTQC